MMNRNRLEEYIAKTYGVIGETPWQQYPCHKVFRHYANKKWFAVCMELPKEKIGLQGKEPIQVVNVKCEPLMIGSLLQDRGIYPGYHMNKNHWITLCLDGSVPTEKVQWLLDMSFDLTRKKMK